MKVVISKSRDVPVYPLRVFSGRNTLVVGGLAFVEFLYLKTDLSADQIDLKKLRL